MWSPCRNAIYLLITIDYSIMSSPLCPASDQWKTLFQHEPESMLLSCSGTVIYFVFHVVKLNPCCCQNSIHLLSHTMELNLVVVTWNSIHLLSHAMELNLFVVTCYRTQSSCCHILWNTIHSLLHTMEPNPLVVTYYGIQSTLLSWSGTAIHLIVFMWNLNPYMLRIVSNLKGTQRVPISVTSLDQG